MNNQAHVCEYLKIEMAKRELSLRGLAEQSGIDHATLSKIMNGKRKANLNHLQRLSSSLKTNVTDLLSLPDHHDNADDDLSKNLEAVQTLVATTHPEIRSITLNQMNTEIEKYAKQSITPQGRQDIQEKLSDKMSHSSNTGTFIKNIHRMYNDFMSMNGRPKEIALMGAALLYFVVTTDLIPDYLLPIGLLDDALIVQAVSQRMEHKNMLM